LQEILSPNEIKARVGDEVVIAGWVHDVRILGGLVFVLVRNSRGIVQVTAPKKSVKQDVFELITHLHQEDVVRFKGVVKESNAARLGFEVIPSEAEILSKSATPLPLDPRGVTPAGLDTRLVWRSLDLRRPESAAVFKIENAIISGAEKYLLSNRFMRAFTPSILGGISEGGSEVFKIDFYGKPAFLRQDPQLHRQLVIAGGFDRIYDLGTNWRAEASHTPRHLSEHRTIAPELAFISDERDTMRVEESMVLSSIQQVQGTCQDELATLGIELEAPKTPFPELDFPQAYDIIEQYGGRGVIRGEDISDESGRILGRYMHEEYGSDYFFLNRFPSRIKPFYVMKVDSEPEHARSVDLMYKGLELSSGGQREHRHDKIISQIREKGMDEAGLKWFTEPFRYGVPPHGGFSFGLERFTAYILGIENVKEAALFPRDPDRLQP
jgi:aspartyl-tRNA synthetase